jgi:hypothetical protein
MTVNLRSYRITVSRKTILGESLMLFWGNKQGVDTLLGYWIL